MDELVIRRLELADADLVLGAGPLFDRAPQPDWTRAFLTREGHHLLFAFAGEEPVGMVSGVETLHPDKGVEMFLYELGVVDAHRRKGVARALVKALAEVAREAGCYGMWVAVDPDNEPALRTYASTGAPPPEGSTMFTWTFEATSAEAQA